ncbi:PREDICTED: meiotic recombination protein REC114 [Pseudopodoces humilis]|uniref:meiotic recombination protein REC114 n=1 Tax=Pseudopodoces humilis TaxID=181119 RepID=UPI0006B8529F|nr:PREDICTED: meiotic recombination protein REC114 [Pseudopodoces humilis]
MAQAAGGGCGSEPGPASAPGSAGDTSLLGGATVWPLKRYGRFLPPKDGDDEGQNTSWKVFESNEESGPLVLTIVESGHFFISQERTVLEGFSLIDSHKWLKVVRRAECLLLRAQAKNECRMFRVQFGGSSKEEVQEHCCSCVQKLSEYIPVQGAEEQSQQLCHGTSQDTQGMDTEHASVLRQRPELPPALPHPAWSARELGPFIRLCLMDQHFPAFVEDVEKELHRLAEE